MAELPLSKCPVRSPAKIPEFELSEFVERPTFTALRLLPKLHEHIESSQLFLCQSLAYWAKLANLTFPFPEWSRLDHNATDSAV
jgi:hypothetical protein